MVERKSTFRNRAKAWAQKEKNHGKKAKWVLFGFTFLLILLCTNILRTTGEPRSFYLQVINGLIMAILLNGTMLLSLTHVGIKFRYLIILPLIISGIGVSFVMSAYHLIWIPAVFILYFRVGYKLFTEVQN